MTDFEEFLLQLDVNIWNGSNEPALDLKLNGSIATIAYLHTVGKLAYPIYEFIDWFVIPLLDILMLIHTNSGGDFIIQGALKIVEEFLQILFVGFISWEPMVHSCITFLAQDAE